jgi:hypothetical protein
MLLSPPLRCLELFSLFTDVSPFSTVFNGFTVNSTVTLEEALSASGAWAGTWYSAVLRSSGALFGCARLASLKGGAFANLSKNTSPSRTQEQRQRDVML